MKIQNVLIMVVIIIAMAAILTTGCITSDNYGPVVKLNITGKYTESKPTINYYMVCTNIGSYRVRGPGYGAESTSASDDWVMWNNIPLNQEIRVRIDGSNLWWIDWNANKNCGSCKCECSMMAPTQITPIPTCNCGYSS